MAQENPRSLDRAETLVKLGLSVAGVVYAMGFLVVAIHLSRFGVTPFGVIRAQYILAGLWVLVPFALVIWSALVGAAFFRVIRLGKESESSRSVWGKAFWTMTALVRVSVSVILTFGILMSAYGVILLNIPNTLMDISAIERGTGLKVLVFVIVVILCVMGTWVFVSDIAGKDGTLSLVDLFWGAGYFGMTVVVFVGYLGFFATTIYPSIPHDLGGGRPTSLRVMFNSEADGASIGKILRTDPADELIGLRLILETDESFFVVNPADEGTSIELPRSMISLAMFGSSREGERDGPTVTP